MYKNNPPVRHEPVQVMPPVYEIPLNMWRWCKLGEVCKLVPKIAWMAGNEFQPTCEELVWRFAPLVRPVRAVGREFPRRRLFRYSLDGKDLRATPVLVEGDDEHLTCCPSPEFVLDIGTPYPKDLFVPEGWVIDTLKAIRSGAESAGVWGELKVGLPAENEPTRTAIHLNSK